MSLIADLTDQGGLPIPGGECGIVALVTVGRGGDTVGAGEQVTLVVVGLVTLSRSGDISGLISFEPDRAEVYLDGTRLRLEPGPAVIPHGPDGDLTTAQVRPAGRL